MEKEAISTIKNHLSEVDSLTDPYVTQLRSDERKGVQQLLNQLEKRLAKEQDLKKQFYLMQTFERKCYQEGYRYLAGIDEVGRGPLAGPVVAAAVVLPEDSFLPGLNDSKQLSEKKRLALAEKIQQQALAIGIGEVPAETIDQVNIYQASKIAMKDSVANLSVKPDFLLIDAMSLETATPQEKIIKGDAKSVSIAAASIIAKVYRDNLMSEYHKRYPYYAFDQNAGYGTKAHLTGLSEHGITPIHRKSYAPIKKYL